MSERIKQDIEKYGWHFIYFFDPEGQKQDFGYTVGFEETFSFPDIMIAGLGREIIHGICSDIAYQLRKGESIQLGMPVSGIIGGDYQVVFKLLKQQCFEEYLGGCLSYYKKAHRACVMFWPDKKGVFPFEEQNYKGPQSEVLEIIK